MITRKEPFTLALLAKSLTFAGGIVPDRSTFDKYARLRYASAPARLLYPLAPGGEADFPAAGQPVLKGEALGRDADGVLLHAGISGVSAGVSELTIEGERLLCGALENDGANRLHPSCVPFTRPLSQTAPDELIALTDRCGLADSPLYGVNLAARIREASGRAHTLIVSGCETQPYLLALSRMLAEQPQKVINGAKILMKALGVRKGVIAVTDNNPDAIRALRKLLGESRLLEIAVMRCKYPQEDPRQLIYALTDKELPFGQTPLHTGHFIVRADTAAALFDAFVTGIPVTEHLLTVNGSRLREPAAVYAPIGMTLEALLTDCAIDAGQTRFLYGSPFTGRPIDDLSLPVTKQSEALLLLEALRAPVPKSCIRCGRCARVCPMHLLPSDYLPGRRLFPADRSALQECTFCGACEAVCPGYLPLTELLRRAKSGETAAPKKTAAPPKPEKKPPEENPPAPDHPASGDVSEEITISMEDEKPSEETLSPFRADSGKNASDKEQKEE